MPRTCPYLQDLVPGVSSRRSMGSTGGTRSGQRFTLLIYFPAENAYLIVLDHPGCLKAVVLPQ